VSDLVVNVCYDVWLVAVQHAGSFQVGCFETMRSDLSAPT